MGEKAYKSLRDRIEIMELRRTIKRKIREDIKECDASRILEIMQNSRSIKKVKREIYPYRTLIPKMRDSKGKLIYGRIPQVQMVT